jgi:plastocyanin
MARTLARVTAALAAGIAIMATASVMALRWLPLDATEGARDVREIVLVARDMAFHREGEPGASNPTLWLQAGSRVRIVVRSDERGITHNFAIPEWNVDSGVFKGPGAARVEFVVPAAKGRHDYQCTPHATMMRGRIEIR